jgi:hypothetical protein
MNTDNLKPVNSEDLDDDLLPEYDEATLVDRYRQGTNLIKLDPDIADAFPTEQSVNEALRKLLNPSIAA